MHLTCNLWIFCVYRAMVFQAGGTTRAQTAFEGWCLFAFVTKCLIQVNKPRESSNDYKFENDC